MPKPSLKNPFARRRSSGNVLDIDSPSTESPQTSFRVIERPDKSKINFDASNRASHVPRPFSSPLQQLRGKSVDDLTYHTNGSVDTAASRKAASALKPGRGSGGTTTSASSEFYQSSSASGRYSSSSTLPSSVEQEHEDEELFTQKRPIPATYSPAPPTRVEEPLPPPPSFSARAQRAFSFGLRSRQSHDRTEPATPAAPAPPAHATPVQAPPTPPLPSHSPSRERALTTSSYASTAVPTRIDTTPDLGVSDFGGDFGKMFDNTSKSPVVGPHRMDSEPLFPPRSYTRQDSASSPSGFRNSRIDNGSPFERRTSRDGLLASAATSPNLTGNKSGFFAEQSRVPATPISAARASQESEGKTYELTDTQDTSMLPLSKSATTSALSPAAASASGAYPWERDSSSATPKASKRDSDIHDDEPLFDASPSGPASRARRPEVLQSKSESAAPRRLTMAQYDILQRYTDKTTDSGDGGDSGGEYDDDDEAERAKQVTKQRRKQEANMSVYRQQMKKVTGGGPTDLPVRPGLDTRSTSTTSLYVGGVPGTPPVDMFSPKQTDDDDEDVPLGILQAHGFPSGNRPPTRLGDSYRPPSVAAQRSSTALPPFARRLPQDPYFGAGLVNPAQRESFAFGGAGSVYGGNSAPVSPGGLVGVIANEEQQRQARRGSPNPVTGTYSMPLPPNMPGMNRTSSMGNMQMPGWPPMPGMPMMPPMPMTNDPQMQEFMQMQMQFMQNMQAMMMQQQQQQQQMQTPGMVPPGGMPRPMSSLGVPADQPRTMSMLGAPTAWNPGMASRPASTFDPRVSTYAPSGLPSPGAGYQPSIAPSERSNVGMPSRYRPVQTDEGRSNSMTSSLTLNAFSNQQATPAERPLSQAGGQRKSTIRVIDKPKSLPKLTTRSNEPDEDEESWADMVKKKMKSKRSDRASKTNGDRVALRELYPNVE